MHKQSPQTAERKDAVLTGTLFENCDKSIFDPLHRDLCGGSFCQGMKGYRRYVGEFYCVTS